MNATLADVIRPGTGRGLDFIILDELRKRTGIQTNRVFEWAVSEMLSNALDTDATRITIKAETSGQYDTFTVWDNGTIKISLSDLKLILDFGNKASSKRGFLRVSRGYLGNALKCIFGYSFALSEAKGLDAPAIEVESQDTLYQVQLRPDRVNEVINHEITQASTEGKGNRFTVKLPINREWSKGQFREAEQPIIERYMLERLIKAASMVNPTREIIYDLWGSTGQQGEMGKAEALRQETSILWYTQDQFTELLFDYMRAAPETQIKDFIALFRGLTAKNRIREILHKLENNHDSQTNENMQFFPSTQISQLGQASAVRLYKAMKDTAKPVSKRSVDAVLGCVGEDRFRAIKGCTDLKYHIVKGHEGNPPHPYLLEVAIIEREPDGEGLELYQCVNFMATNLSLFSHSFNVEYRLGRVGITEDSPITLVIHLVSPVLEWLNYGKTGLGGPYGPTLTKAFDKLIPIPKTPREYKPRTPKKAVSWVPSGKIGNDAYMYRLKAFAKEIRAIDAQRTGAYTDKLSSRGWAYLLEGFERIHKGEIDKAQKAINDCRKLGFLPIDFTAQYQDETRRFSGIHKATSPVETLQDIKYQVKDLLNALPIYTTDYWTDEKYYLMMCVEKGDIKNLFTRICRQYHIPIVSSKGWPPIALRAHIVELSKQAEAKGLQPVLLLFYDHDPAGLKISNTFRKNLRDIQRGTGWAPDKIIIKRIGLNAEDIEKYNLVWIENLRTGSGKSSHDTEYIRRFGQRKCEANALFKNNETMEAGLKICRDAIETYYGVDALQRFSDKEKESKKHLSKVYKDPIWGNLDDKLTELINDYKSPEKPEEEPETPDPIHTIVQNQQYYARCPVCGRSFDDSELSPGSLIRCRWCNAQIHIVEAQEGV